MDTVRQLVSNSCIKIHLFFILFIGQNEPKIEIEGNLDVNVGNAVSEEISIHGSNITVPVQQIFDQIEDIGRFFEQIDNFDDIDDIIAIIDTLASNVCVEDFDCFQMGMCSESLCNTQDFFKEKSNSGGVVVNSPFFWGISLVIALFFQSLY